MLAVPTWLPVQRLAVVAAVALSVLLLRSLDRPSERCGSALRSRFVLGVPWGTLVSVAGVLSVYLLLQGGYDHWDTPTTLPFRAWSYFYPLGVVTASFAHVGPSHLVGNLVGTITLGPLAEYAWSHFPRRRGASSFGSWRANPLVRAFLVVPAAVLGVGFLSSLFALGPVIGFSSVVFAFAGVALVYYPLATVVALAAGRVVRLTYATFQTPQLVVEAQPAFSTPWWANIAIQGHALGLLAGVLVGVGLTRARDDGRPSALRLWTGVVLFGASQSLWAVYWFRGNGTYVLYRAVGLGLVFLLASLVAYAVVASDRPLLPDADVELLRAPRWRVGAVVILLATAAISGPAVPYNLFTVTDRELPGKTVDVRDYEVTYDENVSRGVTSSVEVELFGETTAVNSSGVIVRNPERQIWTTAVTKGRLAFAGRALVRVGGVGWRETLVAVRAGWRASGGDVAYHVHLRHDGERVSAFTSPSAEADPVIAGRNVSVVAESDRFLLAVARDDGTVRAPIPERNESVLLDGVLFTREGRRVYAENDGTRVQVAAKETYGG